MPLYNPAIASLSAGTTRVTSGEAILSNLNGVSFGADGQNITASVAAGATATGNVGAIAAGTQTATSGTIVLSNSNGLTFGLSGSTRITASMDAARSLVAGTRTATGSLWSLADSNGVSFGVVTNDSQITASIATSLTNINLSAGTTSNNLSAFVFSDNNNVSFGLNGSTVTATATVATSLSNIRVSAGTTSNLLSAFTLSNSNGVSFGINASTITASTAPPTLQVWDNLNGAAGTIVLTFGLATSNGSLIVGPLNQPSAPFPGLMTANTVLLDVSGNPSGAQSNSHTFTARVGIYTASASTLSLLNSVSTTFGAGANDITNSQLYQGLRYLTLHSSAWSASPSFSQTQYFVALNMESSNAGYDMSWIGQRFHADGVRSGTIGAASTSGNTSMGWFPYIGIYTATTAAMPGSIHISELQKTGSLTGANFMPHVQFNNQVSAF